MLLTGLETALTGELQIDEAGAVADSGVRNSEVPVGGPLFPEYGKSCETRQQRVKRWILRDIQGEVALRVPDPGLLLATLGFPPRVGMTRDAGALPHALRKAFGELDGLVLELTQPADPTTAGMMSMYGANCDHNTVCVPGGGGRTGGGRTLTGNGRHKDLFVLSSGGTAHHSVGGYGLFIILAVE